MPAKEGLPGTDVAVGGVDSLDLGLEGVLEEGIQVAEVPGASPVIHEGVEDVGSIEGRGEYNIFPKL